MLTEGLEDPAREAEVRLLRDDCRWLKVCARQLAAGCRLRAAAGHGRSSNRGSRALRLAWTLPAVSPLEAPALACCPGCPARPPCLQDKVRQLGEEYQRRLQVAAAEARLEAQQQAAAERRQLEQDATAERQQGQQRLQDQRAAAAAAEAEAEEGTTLERARHAAELARLGEQHAAELDAVKVPACCVRACKCGADAATQHCAALPDCTPLLRWLVQAEFAAALAERERQHAQLLGELRAVRSAMSSAVPSRAGTRQEQRPAEAAATAVAGEPEWVHRQHARPAVSAPAGAHATFGSCLLQQQWQQQQRHAEAPGQLMELHSEDGDEEEASKAAGEDSQSQLHPVASWEQPRPTPELMQHLREARALLQPAGNSHWGRG